MTSSQDTSSPKVIAPQGWGIASSEELLSLLLESAGEGIYGVDGAGMCIFANPACVTLLGYSGISGLLGKSIHQLVHHTRADGTPYPQAECRIGVALRTRQGVQVGDEVFWRADGSSFPAEYRSFPILRKGQVVGCVVTFADITERRRSDKLLADQAAALAEVARFPDMNPGPVLRTDMDGFVKMANRAAARVFGQGLVGSCWTDICPGISSASWKRIVGAPQVVPVETSIGDRDYVFSHRCDPQTQLVFVFGADVTELKEAQRALRQSEKLAALGKLSAGLAHELNNPAAAAAARPPTCAIGSGR
jgi:PAS domain S-box-containing protein